jgi:hypothetical protein
MDNLEGNSMYGRENKKNHLKVRDKRGEKKNEVGIFIGKDAILDKWV